MTKKFSIVSLGNLAIGNVEGVQVICIKFDKLDAYNKDTTKHFYDSRIKKNNNFLHFNYI
jgi:hypothetical protein